MDTLQFNKSELKIMLAVAAVAPVVSFAAGFLLSSISSPSYSIIPNDSIKIEASSVRQHELADVKTLPERYRVSDKGVSDKIAPADQTSSMKRLASTKLVKSKNQAEPDNRNAEEPDKSLATASVSDHNSRHNNRFDIKSPEAIDTVEQIEYNRSETQTITAAVSDTYLVQAGAFSDPINANKFRTNLNFRKIPAAIMSDLNKNGSAIYRVIIGSFQSQTSADDYLQMIEQKHSISLYLISERTQKDIASL
ncbi:MAG: SPOR domain-containing protein [Gammaproteobacteria bacterium]|nr:SPOR domain-containing protein [Gammaproteobacteria bacterium]